MQTEKSNLAVVQLQDLHNCNLLHISCLFRGVRGEEVTYVIFSDASKLITIIH